MIKQSLWLTLFLNIFRSEDGRSLWARIARNTDWSTGPLVCPFAGSLALHYLLRSRTLPRSLPRLNDWMAIYCVFFLFWPTVQSEVPVSVSPTSMGKTKSSTLATKAGIATKAAVATKAITFQDLITRIWCRLLSPRPPCGENVLDWQLRESYFGAPPTGKRNH